MNAIFISPPVIDAAVMLLLGGFVLGLFVALFSLAFKEGKRNAPADAEAFRPALGEEQRRFDRLHALFERHRNVDDYSLAARPHELRAIEKEYRELCPPEPTRRSEP